MKKIVFTGAESCGKSHAATLLSKKFDLTLVPEYSRKYLQEKKLNFVFEDIIKIATLQYNAEIEAVQTSISDIVFDTDLITIKIWIEYLQQEMPIWIENAIKKYGDRHYFLMAPTIPWIDDGLRSLEYERKEIHQRYKTELDKHGFIYIEINSKLEDRDNEIMAQYKRLTAQNV